MNSADLPENENERLRRLRELEILDTLEEQAYDDLTLLAAQICDVPVALVSLVDKDRQWFKSHHGLDARETPRDVAFCAHAILGDDLFVVEDSERDERFFDNPLVTQEPNVKFYAGAPLEISSGVRVGTLCVIDHVKRTLSAQQKHAIKALARQVVSLLELRIRVKELEALDNAKDEFIAMVSHELRTPLTSIKGSLSLLMNSKAGSVGGESMQMVELASRNTDRLINIVNDILDVAKLESGKMEITLEKTNIVAVMVQAVELNQGLFDVGGCGLVLQGIEKSDGLFVNGSGSHLVQVLTNLISNAAKFSPKQKQVKVELSSDRDSVTVSVTDFGSGIPETQHSAVFSKFRQFGADLNRKQRGTGLGLSICKQIIDLHNGEIGFCSIPNKMTKFYFRLPLYEDEPQNHR